MIRLRLLYLNLSHGPFDLMESSTFNSELLSYLQQSPTPFHAVSSMQNTLQGEGFVELKESDAWDVKPGKYFVTRNGSTIIAFIKGTDPTEETGLRIVGAHTDSPCLKVKPNPERRAHGYLNIGVEVYGGALLNPWYDRDLSLAGRVSVETNDGNLVSRLINFERAIATIPSLAIHLDREANKGRSINPQKDIPPLLLKTTDSKASKNKSPSFDEILLKQLSAEHPDLNVKTIHGWELCFYDTQAPAITGLNEDFIASARLDNLLSCFIGLKAICEADPSLTSILVCNDHEEAPFGCSCRNFLPSSTWI